MLPSGALSGVELPVTSKYTSSPAAAESCDFGRRVSRKSWEAANAALPVTLPSRTSVNLLNRLDRSLSVTTVTAIAAIWALGLLSLAFTLPAEFILPPERT